MPVVNQQALAFLLLASFMCGGLSVMALTSFVMWAGGRESRGPLGWGQMTAVTGALLAATFVCGRYFLSFLR